MTRENAIAKLKNMQTEDDPEADHLDADRVLCSLLKTLGYQDVVAEWEKVKKWYA